MRKFFKGLIVFLLLVVISFSAYALITGKTYLFKAVYYNFAGIDDYKIFTNDTVSTAAPQPWKIASGTGIRLPDSLRGLLDGLGTVAVLVIKNKEIIFE